MIPASIRRAGSRFAVNDDGNVAVIFAVILIPMLMLVGIGIDYGIASTLKERLDSFADAAALSAVTPTLINLPVDDGKQTASNTFTAQAAKLRDISQIAPTTAIVTSGAQRTATVSYSAAYRTNFMSVFGWRTIQLSGKSSATGGLAPNIDFYMLLDNSPSMAIAFAQDGIDKLVAATPTQGGCAFGCHQSNPAKDNLGNPDGIDNYQLARNLGVTLRIDMVRKATQDLAAVAQSTEANNRAAYRMAISTFDTGVTSIQSLTTDLGAASTAASSVSLLTVYANNYLTATNRNTDTDTNFTTALTSMNLAIPTPGDGTSNASDKPQAVLFLVTDELSDEMMAGSRVMAPPNTSLCDAIKNRGIRIAVLYTTYLPLPTNSFYRNYVAATQPTIGPTLQSCASPGLYFKVDTGGDISAALIALFKLAIPTSFLSE